ncbi:hypothetical protein IKQ19_08015 [Candidatus Saccharibacteria bacterium]|nr:hypothetical protein [Candidatus Saccharibacteria bacterium]
MKKFILAIALSFVSAFSITQGRLLNFSFTTYAINNFENAWPGNLSWSIKIADSLRYAVNVSVLMMNLAHNYYQAGATPTTVSLNHFEDNAVTSSNFLSQAAKNYNFVFYHGHGLPNKFTLWNQYSYMVNTNPGIGVRNTYWAWLSACTVFRNGYSDQEPWFDGVFKGVHSILGLSSLTFGYLTIAKGYQNFAVRWIYGNQKIWDAYYIAVMNIIHTEGGFDIEPKIVYRYGYINGNFFDPWEEKFLNAYKGPVFYNDDYEGIGSRWITLGDPHYE